MQLAPTGRKVMMIAGEASGDMHGAKLVSAMRSKNRNLSFFGLGDRAMRMAGVDILISSSEIAVVGITEVFSNLKAIFNSLRIVKKAIREQRPDLLILIDFPEFNLHVAAYAKKFRVPVLYYIAPQVWAWRSGRVNKIRRRVDHMAVILPFEESYFRKKGVSVTYVGHPLMDDGMPGEDHPPTPAIRNAAKPVLGLLPGSRKSEVGKLLTPMLESASLLARQFESLRCHVAKAPTLHSNYIADFLKPYNAKPNIDFYIDEQGAHSVLARADIVIAASGTVTLESALAKVPMVVVYRVSSASYHIGKRLIRVPNISLVNLIAGREIVPEIIQEAATPLRIASTVYNILQNEPYRNRLQGEFEKVRCRIGGQGASRKVADIAMGMLRDEKNR